MTKQREKQLVELIMSKIIKDNSNYFEKYDTSQINQENALKIILEIIQKKGGTKYLIEVIKEIEWQ